MKKKRILLVLIFSIVLMFGNVLSASACVSCGVTTTDTYVWTGNSSASHTTHSVIVGSYTNGDPIYTTCTITTTYRLYLQYCGHCGARIGTANLAYSVSHNVRH